MLHHLLKSKACSEKIIREKDVLSEADSFRDNKPVSKPVPGAAADSHGHLWQVQSLSVSGSASGTQGLQPPAVYHLSVIIFLMCSHHVCLGQTFSPSGWHNHWTLLYSRHWKQATVRWEKYFPGLE